MLVDKVIKSEEFPYVNNIEKVKNILANDINGIKKNLSFYTLLREIMLLKFTMRTKNVEMIALRNGNVKTLEKPWTSSLSC